MIGRQVAMDQGDGDDVLQAMIAVGGVVQRAGLADDAHGRFLRGQHDAFDLVEPILHQRMQLDGGLRGGLGVELGREGDLEQHVFHDVAAVGPGELEAFAAEGDVVEAPARRGQRAGQARFAP